MRATALAAVLALTACGPTAPGLRVYAAASLRDVLPALADAYAREAGVWLVLSFGASSTLRAQIEHGAPPGVFLSADAPPVDALAAAGLLDGEPLEFAANELVIVVAREAAERVGSWKELVEPGLRLVAAGEGVPLQRYVDRTVAALGERSDAPEAFAERLAANVISHEGNARAVLARVELGDADAAIVYATDARAAAQLETRPVPGRADPATYLAAVIAGPDDQGARAFVGWLRRPSAQAILVHHGFSPP